MLLLLSSLVFENNMHGWLMMMKWGRKRYIHVMIYEMSSSALQLEEK